MINLTILLRCFLFKFNKKINKEKLKKIKPKLNETNTGYVKFIYIFIFK